MPFSMSQASLPTLRNQSQCAVGHSRQSRGLCSRQKIDPSVLLHTRLSPNIFDLARQVGVAADNAKNGSARLAGVEPPRYEDDETTIDQLKARLAKTVAYMKTLDRKAIDFDLPSVRSPSRSAPRRGT